jgi:hypothetical protein
MKKRFVFFALVIVSLFFFPYAYAKDNQVKTLSGLVNRISGSQVFFRSSSAALYSAEVGNAKLTRKYGSPMQMEEILAGDKVEATGLVWPDNSISTTVLRDMSLYTHDSSFSGRVISINPLNGSFTLQSKQYGTQNINTNQFTVFKKNGQASFFSQVELGITEAVKGSWERNYENVLASSVAGVLRLISIEITGTLTGTNGKSLTVTADNAIYGVDTSAAKILSKNNKVIDVSGYRLGDIIKVTGRHVAEGVAITASVIKDLSLSK